jgi:hypothetical protein
MLLIHEGRGLSGVIDDINRHLKLSIFNSALADAGSFIPDHIIGRGNALDIGYPPQYNFGITF